MRIGGHDLVGWYRPCWFLFRVWASLLFSAWQLWAPTALVGCSVESSTTVRCPCAAGYRCQGQVCVLDEDAAREGDSAVPAIDASSEPSDGAFDASDSAPLSNQRQWVQRNPSTAPSERNGAAMIYHPGRGTTVIYGGGMVLPEPSALASMWEYDGTRWTQICESCAPGPRYGHTMVFDAARRNVILFGGTDDSGVSRNDVWEWDGSNWTERTDIMGTAPSPRQFAHAAYDSGRQLMVVFGGKDTVAFDDTYEYDGIRWYGPFTPTTRPSARYSNSSAVYSDGRAVMVESRNRIVIYGGVDDPNYFDDAWAWNGMDGEWVELCAECTGMARAHQGFAYDTVSGRLVVVGGFADGQELAGTWESVASSFRLTGEQPGARDSVGMALDLERNAFVLFGGNGESCGGDCGETWEYVLP